MPLLGGKIDTPRDLYLHKLGAALTMEQTLVELLPKLQEHANDPNLEQALRTHLDETRKHVDTIERAFGALGAEVDNSPCPAIDGLEKEGEANLKLVADSLNDHVIVSGVCETEHHEIAVYEGLITQAEAMDEQDVAAMLRETLENEQATLRKAEQLAQQLAQRAAAAV